MGNDGNESPKDSPGLTNFWVVTEELLGNELILSI